MIYKELYFPWSTFNREEEINKAIKGATYVEMVKKEALEAKGEYNLIIFAFFPETIEDIHDSIIKDLQGD